MLKRSDSVASTKESQPRHRSDYQPINHLTFFSKLMEKIILNQLWNHFKTNNLLPSYQSAYRANHPTETAILNLCDIILQNMEKT